MHNIYTKLYGIGDIIAGSWRQFKKNFWFIFLMQLSVLLPLILLFISWVAAGLKFGVDFEGLLNLEQLLDSMITMPFMMISVMLGAILMLLSGIVGNMFPIRIIKSSIDGEKLGFVKVLKKVIRRLPAALVIIAIFIGLFLLLGLLFYFILKNKLDNFKIMAIVMLVGLPIYLCGMISLFFVTLGNSISVALGSAKNLMGKYWWRLLGIFATIYIVRIIFGGALVFLVFSILKLIGLGSNTIFTEIVKEFIIYLTGLFAAIAMLSTCINLDAMTGKKLLPRVEE